jgi:hypothetical protein
VNVQDLNYWFNICEAAFWAAIATAVFFAKLRRQTWRSFNLPLGFSFLVFSFSDYLEANVGPSLEHLWLFAMKAACVLSFAYFAFKYYRGLK